MAYALSLISPPAITTFRSRSQDPAPTAYDPNDPKGKQQAIHKAESFAEYLAKRGAGGGAPAPAADGDATRDPAAPAAPPPAAPAPAAYVEELNAGGADTFARKGYDPWEDPELTTVTFNGKRYKVVQ